MNLKQTISIKKKKKNYIPEKTIFSLYTSNLQLRQIQVTMVRNDFFTTGTSQCVQ